MNTGIMLSRLAPAEKTSSGDHRTTPLYDASASSTALARPSTTPLPMRCSLEVMLAMSTSPSSVHRRISSLRKTSVPLLSGSAAPAPSTASGKCWRA